MQSKVTKYTEKDAYRKEWIDIMYVFKNEALRDKILDQNEIELWNALLTEYVQKSKRNDSAAAQQGENLEPNFAKEVKQLQEKLSSLSTQPNGDGRLCLPS